MGQKLVVDEDIESQRKNNPSSGRVLRKGDIYDSSRRREYSAEVLGAGINDDVNDEFWKSLDLGPEQIAIYDIEMAKVRQMLVST